MARSSSFGKEAKESTGRSVESGPPDSVAVALTYKPDSKDQAPVVAASGRGYLAERIKEMAGELDIPIRQDADLVEILAATEVGEEIPVEAFVAVAEILRYVYALNGQNVPNPSE